MAHLPRNWTSEYAQALGTDMVDAARRISRQRGVVEHGYQYGERIRRPNINHCRECEQAYETGRHAPEGHPWTYDKE